jgi:hypothetical protein
MNNTDADRDRGFPPALMVLESSGDDTTLSTWVEEGSIPFRIASNEVG